MVGLAEKALTALLLGEQQGLARGHRWPAGRGRRGGAPGFHGDNRRCLRGAALALVLDRQQRGHSDGGEGAELVGDAATSLPPLRPAWVTQHRQRRAPGTVLVHE